MEQHAEAHLRRYIDNIIFIICVDAGLISLDGADASRRTIGPRNTTGCVRSVGYDSSAHLSLKENCVFVIRSPELSIYDIIRSSTAADNIVFIDLTVQQRGEETVYTKRLLRLSRE